MPTLIHCIQYFYSSSMAMADVRQSIVAPSNGTGDDTVSTTTTNIDDRSAGRDRNRSRSNNDDENIRMTPNRCAQSVWASLIDAYPLTQTILVNYCRMCNHILLATIVIVFVSATYFRPRFEATNTSTTAVIQTLNSQLERLSTSSPRQYWHLLRPRYLPDPIDTRSWAFDQEEDMSAAAVVLKPSRRPSTVDKKKLASIDASDEALATVHAALELLNAGRTEKARRLFDHAIALAPNQPDVLTEYGYFVEHYGKDIVQAETMYTKALLVCPWHRAALENRERTSKLVEEIDNRMLEAIDEKRIRFLRIPYDDPGLCRTMKEFYFMHIYHTVALEGNTMSPLQTRWVTRAITLPMLRNE